MVQNIWRALGKLFGRGERDINFIPRSDNRRRDRKGDVGYQIDIGE